MPYIPNTDKDRAEMLRRIGVAGFEELLAPVPAALRCDVPLATPEALSELELLALADRIANTSPALVTFAGAGVYDHFIPTAVWRVVTRPEFMTAYTPYQPEVSQGTLQVIYEFQTHICRLTAMDAANASMYDGASAAAEATLTAMSATGRDKIIIVGTFNPLYVDVIKSYLSGRQAEIHTLPFENGVSDIARLADLADDRTAGIVISQPNFFGCFEDIASAGEIIHRVGGLLLVGVDPIAMALVTPPGELGADIVFGEGQPLGIPMAFGGPLVGFYASSRELIRRLPGRLAARTLDADGRVGYTLTLQTREQHIRRDKATSNICTNQALCATAATVYLSLLGRQGLCRVAELCLERARYAAEKIAVLEGYQLAFTSPYLRECVIQTPRPAAEIIDRLCAQGILAGVDLGRFYPQMKNFLLVAFTEKRSYQEIDRLLAGLRAVGSGIVNVANVAP